jgi:serine/threonine protein kinase
VTRDDWRTVWQVYGSASELPEERQRSFVESSLTAPELRQKAFELLRGLGDTESAEGNGGSPAAPPEWRFLRQPLGRFEMTGALGRGGAGEVYRAFDPELGRSVAIKCIAPSRLGAPSAVSHFIHEARSASALNHPGIVTVYEVIRSSEAVGIVMELVEGESFRALTGAAHPVAEVAAWGQRIAEALAASHAAGIIHRDIKPENLMLRRDGYVKILDFGLAVDPARGSGDLPAGTLRYMSPEQSRGAPLSPASDIFSLGIVLYELATGAHPFARPSGNDSTMVVAEAISAAAPAAPSTRIPMLGGRFDSLILQMLARDPAARPAAAEVASRLESILARSRGAARRRYWAAAALVVLGAVAVERWTREPPAELAPLHIVPFTAYQGSETQPSFSPDGSRIAFAWNGAGDGNKDIYLKGIEEDAPHRLTADAAEDFSPHFSPDGGRIAFLRHTREGNEPEVVVIPAAGGAEERVARIAAYAGYHGMAWWPDGRSLLVRDKAGAGTGIVRLFLTDGRKEPLTTPPATFGDAAPAISPDGGRVAFIRNGAGGSELCLVGAGGGPVRTLVRAHVSRVVWSGDRQLLYAGSGALWRIGVDGARPTSPVKIAVGSFADLTADRDGKRLAFNRSYRDFNIWRLQPDGKSARQAAASSAEDSEPAWSPDGSRFVLRSDRSGTFELYTYAADGSGERQITRFGAHLGSARWSPDGAWIAFDGNRAPVDPSVHHHNVFLVPAAGGAMRRLTDDRENCTVPNWSSDGRWVYCGAESGTWKLPVDGGTPVRVTADSLFDVAESPDGRTLYYTKFGGAPGIWERPAGGGAESRVAGTEGVQLYRYWQVTRDGIFFVDGMPNPTLRYLDFRTRAVRAIGALPAKLVRGPRGLGVSLDGSRILYTLEDLTISDIQLIDRLK